MRQVLFFFFISLELFAKLSVILYPYYGTLLSMAINEFLLSHHILESFQVPSNIKEVITKQNNSLSLFGEIGSSERLFLFIFGFYGFFLM